MKSVSVATPLPEKQSCWVNTYIVQRLFKTCCFDLSSLGKIDQRNGANDPKVIQSLALEA